ncbi:hypothetical protein BpHYR1_031683 [Brachionus plicatilis]|uniref:Uncharacterized protein n=1 Tax=Brachionus plicatilis TaxID=10195 RepID=A0A3M7PRU6_BRAPC|nr:hypothetical protein BpHYR1_031683 [Brachionus plicatilis]
MLVQIFFNKKNQDISDNLNYAECLRGKLKQKINKNKIFQMNRFKINEISPPSLNVWTFKRNHKIQNMITLFIK